MDDPRANKMKIGIDLDFFRPGQESMIPRCTRNHALAAWQFSYFMIFIESRERADGLPAFVGWLNM
jgi:hypothetical protein